MISRTVIAGLTQAHHNPWWNAEADLTDQDDRKRPSFLGRLGWKLYVRHKNMFRNEMLSMEQWSACCWEKNVASFSRDNG